MPLTEQERAELETLENPNVQFLSSAIGDIWSMLSVSKDKRKRRVVELRTKSRMEELGLDPKENFEEFYRIRREGEELFDHIWLEEERSFNKKFDGESDTEIT